MHKRSLLIVRIFFWKWVTKRKICTILEPKRGCMRNTRFEVCEYMRKLLFKVGDCMRKLLFKVRDCMKEVCFEVRLHEKCVISKHYLDPYPAPPDSALNCAFLLTVPSSCTHLLCTASFSCSHTLWITHFSSNTFLALKSCRYQFVHPFSNTNLYI